MFQALTRKSVFFNKMIIFSGKLREKIENILKKH